MNKIAVVSLYTQNIYSYAKYTSQSKKIYCQKNGYDFINYSKSLNINRSAAWSKIIAIKNNLSNYQWILWIDADAMICNCNIKIESFIDNNYDFIFSKDVQNLNSGVFLIKNTNISKQFLNDIDNEKCYQKYKNDDWYEQRAIIELLNTNKYSKYLKFISSNSFNSYLDIYKKFKQIPNIFKEGDFILHIPAKNTEYRQEIFKNMFTNFFYEMKKE